MAEKIKAKSIYRIGIVVKDAEAIAAQYEKLFELDPSKKMVLDTRKYERRKFLYYGEPCDFQMKLIIFPVGGIEIELIEPLDDKGPYAEFLREKGGGMRHLNIEVDDNENFVKAAEEIGAPYLTAGGVLNVGWKYYDTTKNLGTIYEVCQDGYFPDV